MVEIIYRERIKINMTEWIRNLIDNYGDEWSSHLIDKNEDEDKWIRHLVKVKPGEKIDSVDFLNPIYDKRVELIPLENKLYLLDYLKISFPLNIEKLTVKMVLDRIPKELLPDVFAVEIHQIFDDVIWHSRLFPKEKRENNIVAFVALLTEKDTGKQLPSTKFTINDRPIGISDTDWDNVVRECHLN